MMNIMQTQTVRGWMALAILGGLALLGGGCARRFPSEQIPKVKFLILPFAQPPAMSENTITIRGWWLGAWTVRQNERAGEMMAETLSRQMAQLDFLNLFSAIDLKYYFANKGRRLKEHFQQQGRALSDAEVVRLLGEVPQLEYAKDLGADKLFSGKLIQQYMGENRTIHNWWSVIEADVEVVDVATGKVEWSRHYRLRGSFGSMLDVQERLGERVIEELKQEYFLPMAAK